VAGGHMQTGGNLISAELYDPVTSSWIQAANLNFKRGFHAAALLKDGKALVVGGQGEGGDTLTSAEVYER
jgi:hypothetical protein